MASQHNRDLSLVQDILDGDPAAWNTFVERYSDRVWRRSWQLCNEACIHKHRRGGVFCVFHALAAGGVQPASDERPGCDEGLELYAFIFDYLFNRERGTGKLKSYDGRSDLDTFVAAVMRGHLRTDWIRHRRRLRVDQITYPEEIERLERPDRQVYEQMLMQRSTETIARNVGLSLEETEQAQERVTHALMANGNLHLILRNPEGPLDEVYPHEDGAPQHVVPLRRTVDEIWERICLLVAELHPHEQILLDMAFEEELDARTILERCQTLGLVLPVTPRTGNVTIHTVYQSLDVILNRLGEMLADRFPETLAAGHTWLNDDEADVDFSAKGLKTLLKHMGISPQGPSAPRQTAAS